MVLPVSAIFFVLILLVSSESFAFGTNLIALNGRFLQMTRESNWRYTFYSVTANSTKFRRLFFRMILNDLSLSAGQDVTARFAVNN